MSNIKKINFKKTGKVRIRNFLLSQCRKIIPRSTLYISVILAPLLLATRVGSEEYKPPQGSPPPVKSMANGSRGSCTSANSIPLTLLTPKAHVGQTTSAQPTLVWFLTAESSYFYRVSLYAVDSNGSRLLSRHENIMSAAKIASVTMPNISDESTSTQQYVWEVAIACDSDVPEFDFVATAAVDVVELSTSIETELSSAQTSAERSQIYAKNGFWYDSMREAMLDYETSGNLSRLSSLLTDLAASETLEQSQRLVEIREIISP